MIIKYEINKLFGEFPKEELVNLLDNYLKEYKKI